ncbi:MAG: dihydrofolate reductase family protein [Cyclobacteriaceae bacterium]
MRKIILSAAVSLDGFIEDQNGNYDWCPPPLKSEMSEFLNGIDAIFMGRKSYELCGTKMFPGKDHYVFSDTLNGNTKGIYVIRKNMFKTVSLLQQEKGKDIWLFGGASLISTFINENLVDEMWLAFVPIILGGGKPLFENISDRKKFQVTDSKVSGDYLSVRLSKNNIKTKRS